MSGIILLGLGLVAYLLFKSGSVLPATPESKALFDPLGGGKYRYKPVMTNFLVNQLVAKRVTFPEDMSIARTTMIQEATALPPNQSAYWAVRLLNEGGFDVWSSPTLHFPSKPGQVFDLEWYEPGVRPQKGFLVMLISASDEWPGVVPPPQNVPPIPSNVPPIPVA